MFLEQEVAPASMNQNSRLCYRSHESCLTSHCLLCWLLHYPKTLDTASRHPQLRSKLTSLAKELIRAAGTPARAPQTKFGGLGSI